MGLFDFLSRDKNAAGPTSKSEREILRLERVVGNKLSQNYDRQEAIEALSKMATARSAMALFKRFDWSMDPSITDHEEKELAVRGIVATGEEALEPLRSYCKKAQSLTWPLKALKEIVPRERIVEELLEVLDLFDTEYVRNVEPKLQLIQNLEEYPNEDVRIAVEPFLGDVSEPVRFAATRTVFAMGAAESVPALVAALEEEESLRVKNAMAQGIEARAWVIPDELREACSAALPDGYELSEGKVRQRS
jgi:HEAT repeat protein